ncbi:MAG: rhodanese-like domain-containing protein [Verrucomicrobiota bacterium]
MSKIRFITIEKLLEMKENEEPFTLVDTLGEESYREEHIPGAINVPVESVVREIKGKVDADAPVVTYCAGYTCEASTLAARKLIDIGFEQIFDFKGGLHAWKNAGFDAESS